jgi:hypothetical protein
VSLQQFCQPAFPSLYRVRSGAFPCFIGTTESSDSRYPFQQAPFSSPDRTTRVPVASLPSPAGTPAKSLEGCCPVPPLTGSLFQHVHAAFRRLESVGSRDAVISGLYHTAYTRAISSFAASVARALRKNRFRLVANLYRVGLTTHWVPPHYFKMASLAISPKCPGFSWRTKT